jgi:pimeloyl-ACP methyl ester carboxylesterase
MGLCLLLGVPPVRAAYWFVHPPRRRLTEEERSLARRQLPGLEDVVLTTRDGLVLRGWFVPGSRRDAVVLVHGLTDNRAELLPEAEILSAKGHGVLLYDSRASGDSDGDTATWGDRERLDVAAALDFLGARADVDAARVGAYGFSVGSTTVALAAVEDERIHAVLLGPIWPTLEDELKRKMPRFAGLSAAIGTAAFGAFGVGVQALRPIDVIGKIPPRPLMLISGSVDDDTPPAIMERVHAAVPSAPWWLVPGAAHGHYAEVAPVEYPRRLAGFFDAALADGR